MEPNLLACRIIDGLFIGNYVSSQDYDFITSNKVTHIINCCGLEIPNRFKSIKYFTFFHDFNFYSYQILSKLNLFITKAFDIGECVLVSSYFGNQRSCVLVIAYLMYKYKWSLKKAKKMVNLNNTEMNINNNGFIMKLKGLEKKIKSVEVLGESENEFKLLKNNNLNIEKDIILLNNTFINSLPKKKVNKVNNSNVQKKGLRKRRVKFAKKVEFISPDILLSNLKLARKCRNQKKQLKSAIKKSPSGKKRINNNSYVSFLLKKKNLNTSSFLFIDNKNSNTFMYKKKMKNDHIRKVNKTRKKRKRLKYTSKSSSNTMNYFLRTPKKNNYLNNVRSRGFIIHKIKPAINLSNTYSFKRDKDKDNELSKIKRRNIHSNQANTVATNSDTIFSTNPFKFSTKRVLRKRKNRKRVWKVRPRSAKF